MYTKLWTVGVLMVVLAVSSGCGGKPTSEVLLQTTIDELREELRVKKAEAETLASTQKATDLEKEKETLRQEAQKGVEEQQQKLDELQKKLKKQAEDIEKKREEVASATVVLREGEAAFEKKQMEFDAVIKGHVEKFEEQHKEVLQEVVAARKTVEKAQDEIAQWRFSETPPTAAERKQQHSTIAEQSKKIEEEAKKAASQFKSARGIQYYGGGPPKVGGRPVGR